MRRTSLLDGPTGRIEYLTVGDGAPGAVFAHGLAGSIATTRPFGSGVTGRRTFLHFRGHGASDAPEGDWTYGALASELRAVADHVGARNCLGVSMGAGALCAVLEETPERFDRIVLMLPAVVDRPREQEARDRFAMLADLVDEHDVDGIAEVFVRDQPVDVRDSAPVRHWAAEQARLLAGTPVSRALRALPGAVPLADRAALADVTAPALVVTQEDDAAHPVGVARELSEALPSATLEVLPAGGVLWSHRRRVRELVSGFLDA